jgi:hypothetical protein
LRFKNRDDGLFEKKCRFQPALKKPSKILPKPRASVIGKSVKLYLLQAMAILFSSCSTLTSHRCGDGPEDLRRWEQRSGGPLLITGATRAGAGGLETLDPAKGGDFKPLALQSADGSPWQGAAAFRPHGLCVVLQSQAPGWAGKDLCYAVNTYDRKRRAVEVFELRPGVAIHLGALGGESRPFTASMNGIAALPDGTVYVSNFHFWPPRWAPKASRAALCATDTAPKDALLRFQPSKGAAGSWAVAGQGFGGVNGLGWDARTSRLLIAGFSSGRVAAAPLDADGWPRLEAAETLVKGQGRPDNLAQSENGKWFACNSRGGLRTAIQLLVEERFPLPISLVGNRAVEFDPSGATPPKTFPIPRRVSLPSTVTRVGGRLYAGRIVQGNVRSWEP